MSKLDEYKNHPKWIDSMTKEQQHEWYSWIKKNIDRIGRSDELDLAIKTYEQQNGIHLINKRDK